MPLTQWNPADAGAGVTITGAGLTVDCNTPDGTNYANCRATTFRGGGRWFFEFTVGSAVSSNGTVGIANATYSLTEAIFSGDPNSIQTVIGGPDNVVFNGSTLSYDTANTGSANVAGNVISVAVDLDNLLWWSTSTNMRSVQGAGAWNSSTSASPASGTGGNSFAGFTGPAAICISSYNEQSGTLNTSKAFTVACPARFLPWEAGEGPPYHPPFLIPPPPSIYR